MAGLLTQASNDLSAFPASGVASGPTYQSLVPSSVIALTPSTSVMLGVSTSASNVPPSVPSLVIEGSAPTSLEVTSISTRTSAVSGTGNVINTTVIAATRRQNKEIFILPN